MGPRFSSGVPYHILDGGVRGVVISVEFRSGRINTSNGVIDGDTYISVAIGRQEVGGHSDMRLWEER
jgi:hypothetical protein